MEESDRFNIILLPKSLSLISIVKEGQCFAPPFLNKIHPLLCLTAKYEIVMISSLIAVLIKLGTQVLLNLHSKILRL